MKKIYPSSHFSIMNCWGQNSFEKQQFKPKLQAPPKTLTIIPEYSNSYIAFKDFSHFTKVQFGIRLEKKISFDKEKLVFTT